MGYDPNIHHRRSIRLEGYDYSTANAYFVTLCTLNRELLFTNPILAQITSDVWHALPGWFPTIALDQFVMMPNHIHLIVWLRAKIWASTGEQAHRISQLSQVPTPSPNLPGPSWQIPEPKKVSLEPTLGDVIGTFKSIVFSVCLNWSKTHDQTISTKIWQRNYYECVIRDERALNAVRQYIIDNPRHWATDRDNLDNIRRLATPTGIHDYLADLIR